MTIEEESIEDFIPERTESGMREILLACLQKDPGKFHGLTVIVTVA